MKTFSKMVVNKELDEISEQGCTALDNWKSLLNEKDLSKKKIKQKLKSIYRFEKIEFADLVINAHCNNSCKHCLYSKDYAKGKESLKIEDWKKIIDYLYSKLEIRTFSLAGRATSDLTFEILNYIKSNYKDAKVGMIVEGFYLKKYFEQINDSKLDWLDISIDGFRENHDNQRNKKGSFDTTIIYMEKLKLTGRIKQINVLTTITSINKKSIIKMIKSLNQRGFKNIFLSLILTYANHPNDKLKISKQEFGELITKIREECPKLKDSYIDFQLSFAEGFYWLKQTHPKIYSQIISNKRMEFSEQNDDNEFHLSYVPSSLAWVKELIIFSDGRIMPSKIVSLKEIPENLILGNIKEMSKEISNNKEFIDKLIESNLFSFYVDEFLEERAFFNKY